MNEDSNPMHSLVASFPGRDASAINQFVSGLRVPLLAARFLMKNRSLWPLAAIPAALSMGVFFVVAALLVLRSEALLTYFWERPKDWVVVIWWVLRVVLVPLVLLVAYFFTLMISAVIASPANDRLAARIEEMVTGAPQAVEDSLKTTTFGAARGALQAAANLCILIAVMTPIILFNLIPGIGSFIATVLGTSVGSFFIALDYTDWTLERAAYGWRGKWQGIWANRYLALGFGLGTSALMWIPIVNFMSMPIAVVGGASLALEINSRKREACTEPVDLLEKHTEPVDLL